MTGLTMSQVAKATNVNVATVRYYEKRGLICTPPRTKAGYRMFSYQTVADIKFVKKAQDLGFTLEEIKHLLAICREEDYFPTEEMHQFAVKKHKEIDIKIQQLIKLQSLLELVTTHSPSEQPLSKNQCPIINKLKGGEIHIV